MNTEDNKDLRARFKEITARPVLFIKDIVQSAPEIFRSIWPYIRRISSHLWDFLRLPGTLLLGVLLYLIYVYFASGIELSPPEGTELFNENMAWFIAIFFCAAAFVNFLYLRSYFYKSKNPETRDRYDTRTKAVGLTLTAIGITLSLLLQTKSDRAIAMLDEQTELSLRVPELSSSHISFVTSANSLRRDCFELADLNVDLGRLQLIANQHGEALRSYDIRVDLKNLPSALEQIGNIVELCRVFFSLDSDNACRKLQIAPNADTIEECRKIVDEQEVSRDFEDRAKKFLEAVKPFLQARQEFNKLNETVKKSEEVLDRPIVPKVRDEIWSSFVTPGLAFMGIGLEFSFFLAGFAREREQMRSGAPEG